MILWIKYLIFMAWSWIGYKVFGWHYVDVYVPDQDKNLDGDVIGITFSSSEEYINKVSNIQIASIKGGDKK